MPLFAPIVMDPANASVRSVVRDTIASFTSAASASSVPGHGRDGFGRQGGTSAVTA